MPAFSMHSKKLVMHLSCFMQGSSWINKTKKKNLICFFWKEGITVRFCGFILTWWLCSFKLLCRRVEKKNKKSWHLDIFLLRWRFELTAAMATEKPAWQYPDLWYWSTVSLSKSTSKIREPWHCYSTREKHTQTCTHTRAYTPNYKTIKSMA